MRRFLIIDGEGKPLLHLETVRIEEFRSSPEEETTDPGTTVRVSRARPYTRDVEEAIGKLTSLGAYTEWRDSEESRPFIVIPLDDAYTVNVRPKSKVEISSTGSL